MNNWMTDPEMLNLLANWFDKQDEITGNKNTEVQEDLRRIAAKIERLGDDWQFI